MKKIVSCVAASLLVLSVLSGCGASASTASTQAPAQATEKKDTDTVAVGAVVIARDDVSEGDVYNFVSTIFENSKAIMEQHAKGGELKLEFASSVTSMPYHPGAAKYFEEKGIKVASVKEGAGTGASGDLIFTTGGETGTYYAYGNVLSNYVTSNSSTKVSAITSGGSQANIEEMSEGNAQLGFVQSDVMSYAYNGERLFEAPVKGFSVVAALYMEQVQIVTTDPAIKTVADLKGKTVCIGASGSGTYFNAVDVLGVYGLTEADIKPVFQSFGDSAESLKDGKIDAAFLVAGAPTVAITDLATAKTVYLVGFDAEHTGKLIEASPYYSAYTIPAGTY